jgi:hypothetical protein
MRHARNRLCGRTTCTDVPASSTGTSPGTSVGEDDVPQRLSMQGARRLGAIGQIPT